MSRKIKKRWTFCAPTIDLAFQKAIAEIGCSKEELSVVLVSEEKRGLFGMEGAEPVKIVVTLKDQGDV